MGCNRFFLVSLLLCLNANVTYILPNTADVQAFKVALEQENWNLVKHYLRQLPSDQTSEALKTYSKKRVPVETEKKLAIVVPSYLNKNYVRECLSSIFFQKHSDGRPYQNWHLFYIDDASPDGQHAEVQQFIDECGVRDHCTVIHNETRQGCVYNQFWTINKYVPSDAVILFVDGDDRLAHNQVFEKINEVYQDPSVWMTNGNAWSPQTKQHNSFEGMGLSDGDWQHLRVTSGHIISHLKTCYAWLYKRIKIESVCIGKDFMVCHHDWAAQIAMGEMAGKLHHRYINEVLSINNQTAINTNQTCSHHPHWVAAINKIRHETPYQPLTQADV